MTDAKETANVAQILVTDALDSDARVLIGSLLLSGYLAEKQDQPIGLSILEHLREPVMACLPEQAKQSLSDHATAKVGAVDWIDLADRAHMEPFTGVIVAVGANSTSLEALRREHNSTLIVAVPQTTSEREAVLTVYPDAGAVRLRAGPVMPSLSTITESGKERAKWFGERYDVLRSDHFNPQSEVVKLGEGQPKVCRYCGNTNKGKFKNISHAFPEQIGNKKLLDLLECDICNEHFASTLDDHFGKWSRPIRSTSRIKGKKNKVPSYESADQRIQINHSAGVLNIRAREGDDRLKFDPAAKELVVEFERQPYVPMAIFKSFVKMAVAVMPESDSSDCDHLKAWLLERTHTFESFPYKGLTLFTQFIPGPLPNNKVTYFILKRKAHISDCPYLLFVLQYANYIQQIALPMPYHDVPDGPVDYPMNWFPHPWDTTEHESQYGSAQHSSTDLSSTAMQRGDSFTQSFGFDSVVETTPKDTD